MIADFDGLRLRTNIHISSKLINAAKKCTIISCSDVGADQDKMPHHAGAATKTN